MAVADAHGAAALHHHCGGLGVGLHLQVAAFARRRQVGLGGAPAPAAVRVQLVVAGAFLLRTVEVVVARHAHFLRAGDEGVDQRVAVGDVGHAQRPVGTMECAGAALVVL